MKGGRSKASAIIIVLIGMAVIFGGYSLIKGRFAASKKIGIEQNEINKLLEKNFESEYPATPREVVKYYSRFSKCIYNEKLTDEEIEKMAVQVRKLYDSELLNNNPLEEYIYDLKIDISDYQENKRTITSYSVDSGSNVITWTEDETEFARLVASYTMRESSQYQKTYEEFVLRRDQNNEWKILGFRMAEEADMN